MSHRHGNLEGACTGCGRPFPETVVVTKDDDYKDDYDAAPNVAEAEARKRDQIVYDSISELDAWLRVHPSVSQLHVMVFRGEPRYAVAVSALVTDDDSETIGMGEATELLRALNRGLEAANRKLRGSEG